jgi:acetyl esterase/lipase
MSFDDMPDLGPMMLPGAAAYAASAIEWSRAAVAQTRTELDVSYGADFYQKLDIFLPPDRNAQRVPVLVFMHGGAWRNGFKEWMGFMAPPLVTLPTIFVSVNYRLVPKVKYPIPLEDCFAALRWVRDSIARYGGDPDRVHVGGHSAGGHIAALLALNRERAAAAGLPPGFVKGCFPLSSSFSLSRADVAPGSRREGIIRAILEDTDDGRDGTVLTHVRGNRIPFFLAYGAVDLPDLMEQNLRMAEALAGESCTLIRYIFPGFDHFATNLACRDAAGVWVRTVRSLISP